jgi:competence protein ComEA
MGMGVFAMPEQQNRRKSGNKMSAFLLLVCLISLGSMLWRWILPEDEPAVYPAATERASRETGPAASRSAPERDLIPIHLVGAICQPGIYQVERGSYLYQLVEQAGGLTADAASDRINLALRLDSNQQIHLPTRTEIAANPGIANLVSEPASTLLDLNQADLDQLDALPGIGPSTATAILEFRKKNGSFRSVEDLLQIPGIKESRFIAIKDLVVVNSRS